MEPVRILDTATPWLADIAKNNPNYCRWALKSTGWMVQQEVKKGIRSRAPGGHSYAKGMAAKRRRAIDELMGRKSFRTYRPLGKLLQAVGYDKKNVGKDGSGSVIIGWLSDSAQWLGEIQEGGHSRVITPKMRRMFWAAGIPISKATNEVKIPARPTYDPMYQVLEPIIPKYFEQKIFDYWTGQSTRSDPKKPKAIYRVRGGGFSWAASI